MLATEVTRHRWTRGARHGRSRCQAHGEDRAAGGVAHHPDRVNRTAAGAPTLRLAMDEAAATSPPDPAAILRSRKFLALLVLAAILGVIASLAAWCFLEVVHQANVGAYQSLPGPARLRHHAAVVVDPAAGHRGRDRRVRDPPDARPGRSYSRVRAERGQILWISLPGVILAGLATIGLGAVLGPEAPLIALGGGLGLLAARLVGKTPRRRSVRSSPPRRRSRHCRSSSGRRSSPRSSSSR